MSELNIVQLDVHPRPQPKLLPTVCTGRNYLTPSIERLNDINGLCENYIMTKQSGHIELISGNSRSDAAGFFIWDTDSEIALHNIQVSSPGLAPVLLQTTQQIKSNRFVLNQCSISKPVITAPDTSPRLEVHIDIDFVYSPDQYAACVGVIHLVNSNCFIHLKNGDTHTIIDTDDDPVLHLDAEQGDECVLPILETSRSKQSLTHSFRQGLRQKLYFDEYGIDYESVTILEQYTTYIMHRELPFAENNIWIPACAPITWGWSMRTGFRQDGDACLERQKLLPPIQSHEGMEMPAWNNNNLALMSCR